MHFRNEHKMMKTAEYFITMHVCHVLNKRKHRNRIYTLEFWALLKNDFRVVNRCCIRDYIFLNNGFTLYMFGIVFEFCIPTMLDEKTKGCYKKIKISHWWCSGKTLRNFSHVRLTMMIFFA